MSGNLCVRRPVLFWRGFGPVEAVWLLKETHWPLLPPWQPSQGASRKPSDFGRQVEALKRWSMKQVCNNCCNTLLSGSLWQPVASLLAKLLRPWGRLINFFIRSIYSSSSFSVGCGTISTFLGFLTLDSSCRQGAHHPLLAYLGASRKLTRARHPKHPDHPAEHPYTNGSLDRT